jgi:SAM-dependent methyltransferase
MSRLASGATGLERMARLTELLGGVDIYLLDQVMKGRLKPGSRILDAGCGGGRNLEPFLRCDYDVYVVDEADRAARQTVALAREVGCERPRGWVSRQSVAALAFADAAFDAVVCCAVLHFARSGRQWRAMVEELWRVLAPRGLFFSRLASSIGIEGRVEPLGDGRFRLPDGTDRFLVDRAMLVETSERLGGTLIEPMKTTLVDRQRAMTTWCLVKPA